MKKDAPILTSLLQNDFYKFSMWYFEFRHFRDVKATFGFVNRTTSVPLGQYLDVGAIREEFDHARTVRFSEDEIQWLIKAFGGKGFALPGDFVEFMRTYQLPEYVLERSGDQPRIEFPGLWVETTQWEIPCLMIVNTMINRIRIASMDNDERSSFSGKGHDRLMAKCERIKYYKYADRFTFTDFGTRRCFSPEWHDHVVETFKQNVPAQLAGTSNCYLAKKYGLEAKGTRAHEPEMIMAALAEDDDQLRQVPYKFCDLWSPGTYGTGFQVHLPDTFGSDRFFKTAPTKLAEWGSLRQDSGDPYIMCQKAVRWYERRDQNLKTKTIVPSDGLNVNLMLKLHAHLIDQTKVSPGLGTNGTNDLPGIQPISIVVKPIEANGRSTVKLSDNIAKAMGDPREVERCKRVFRYDESFNKACVY